MDTFSQKSPKMTKIHLVLCLHGLDGFDSDLEFIKILLKKRHFDLKIFSPTANHKQTYDGIRQGSGRILAELMGYVKKHDIHQAYLSVIGHSLGGLYGRCLLGLLFQQGLIPSLFEPISFISIVTPHVGSRGNLQP
jgi:pimeloyl-ACP methyl ester carboxylesterase